MDPVVLVTLKVALTVLAVVAGLVVLSWLLPILLGILIVLVVWVADGIYRFNLWRHRRARRHPSLRE